MTKSVRYPFAFPYLIDAISAETFPGLPFRIYFSDRPAQTVDLIAHLDTGSELSILDGAPLVSELGLDLMSGPQRRLGTTTGFESVARIHRIGLTHPLLGNFTLDAAISTVPLRRNLLGRDFSQHIQLGLREYHQSFFIAPTP